MTVRFEVTTTIAAPPDVVFDLSRDMDLHQRSMSGSGETAIGGVTSGLIGLGESVTLRARHFGVPFTMTSTVTALDRPHRFVDEQSAGPFRSWHHEHAYEPAAGGTAMTDRITFVAPLGPLGRLVARAVLARYMRGIIEQRGASIKAEAERRAGDGRGTA